MNKVSHTIAVTTDSFNSGTTDIVTAYQQWWSQTKTLMRKALCAEDEGQLKKALRLSNKALKITREYRCKIKRES